MNIDQLKGAASKGQGFARANAFQVILPSFGDKKYNSSELNILCTNVNLPGRQIMTQERLIGPKGIKMPTGFVSDDISMTFYVMNDYSIREYFEGWQNRVVNQNTFEIGYNNEYAQDVTIIQLNRQLPINNFFGINPNTNIRSADNKVYECKLLGAYPTTMNQIELNNELDGLVRLNVQLSYRNWMKI